MLSLPAVRSQIHITAFFCVCVCVCVCVCFFFFFFWGGGGGGVVLSTKQFGNYTHCKADRNSALFLTTVLSTVTKTVEYQRDMWTKYRSPFIPGVDWKSSKQ